MEFLDFIVLAAHGAGIHAFHTYANMFGNMACLDKDADAETLDAFLQANDTLKGAIIDSAGAVADGRLAAVLDRSGSDSAFVILTRDPLERLLSVANTHILWWAESASGVSGRQLSRTNLHQYGDVKTFLANKLLGADNMNTLPRILPLLASKTNKYIFFDIHDLYPEHVEDSLAMLRGSIGERAGTQREANGFSIPNALIYKKENSFVRYIRPLWLRHKDVFFAISPCPREFCAAYGLEPHIVMSRDPADLGFTLGDYEGELAFVLTEYAHHAPENARRIVRGLLENRPSLLRDYCQDVSRRHRFASILTDALFLTDAKLLDMAREDPAFAAALRAFLNDHVETVAGHPGWRTPPAWPRTRALCDELRDSAA
ncbi:hypothetical protein [uncultured Desulfovibrio sp.]|uniref:hypothetical protein n=1 Tax=uncultured Desulfovibrio sp. TaxID=167968 RepID=UPI0025CCE29F|nr:hypothetical protein [uncultured Desulfovibrio sp.]